MPRATAEQQLVSSNLQPTNLLFDHNILNSDTNMAGIGMPVVGEVHERLWITSAHPETYSTHI